MNITTHLFKSLRQSSALLKGSSGALFESTDINTYMYVIQTSPIIVGSSSPKLRQQCCSEATSNRVSSLLLQSPFPVVRCCPAEGVDLVLAWFLRGPCLHGTCHLCSASCVQTAGVYLESSTIMGWSSSAGIVSDMR